VDDGVERHSILPRLCEVLHVHVGVWLGNLLAPVQQRIFGIFSVALQLYTLDLRRSFHHDVPTHNASLRGKRRVPADGRRAVRQIRRIIS
jgi:hypothetical protein